MTYRFRMNPGAQFDRLGYSVMTVPDFDGDGQPDYIMSAISDFISGSGVLNSGSIYIFRSGDLNAADAADGTTDRTIWIDDGYPALNHAWRIVGGSNEYLGRRIRDAGDLDNDGTNELLVSFPNNESASTLYQRSYLIDFDGLVAADDDDGAVDRTVHIANLVGETGNYRIDGIDGVGYETTGIGRTGAVGQNFLVLGSPDFNSNQGSIFILDRNDLAALDAAGGGAVDGQFNISTAYSRTVAPNSWRILGEAPTFGSFTGYSLANIGDIDGDGFEELAIGAFGATADGMQYAGQTYIVSQRDFAEADAADGTADGVIRTSAFLNPANFSTDGMQSIVFDGPETNGHLGWKVGAGGDGADADGFGDLLVAGQNIDGSYAESGAVYLVASSDFQALDLLDGADDNRIDITRVGTVAGYAAASNSYMFVPPTGGQWPGEMLTSAGDWNGDGVDDIIIGLRASGPADYKGRIYIISGQDLAQIDALDGADGKINLGNVHFGTDSYEIIPRFGSQSADNTFGRSFWAGVDGLTAGRNSVIIGSPHDSTETWVLQWRDREAFDNRDGDGAGGPDTGANDNIFTLNWVTPTCFTAGTLIRTARGDVAVEALRVGDLVLTRDHGLQPLRWAGARRFGAAEIAMAPQIAPVRISAGALGPAMPAQDLVVSPQHRILVTGGLALRLAGAAEVLIAAKHLVGLPGVAVAPAGEPVWYHHILFDRHEIVEANGAPAESLLLGPEARRVLSPEALAEIALIFPDIGIPEPARPIARGGDLRRHARRADKAALDGRV
jgi:hypothetical protein